MDNNKCHNPLTQPNFTQIFTGLQLHMQRFAALFEPTILEGVCPILRIEERHGFVKAFEANTSFTSFLGNKPVPTPPAT
jgi:hypothetical protein